MSNRKYTLYLRFAVWLVQLGTFFGCTEPFEAPIEDFEEILVIDAFITDELKTQEIFLSRTFIIGEDVRLESNAEVQVSDDLGNVFPFEEREPGTYASQVEFSASADRSYSLSIVTENGSAFSAGPTQITGTGSLDDVSVAVTTSADGQEGLSILANSRGIGDNASFFRYDYVETFQIRSPFVSGLDLVIVSENPTVFDRVPKTREEATCYKTSNSQEIIITNSEGLISNEVENFEVKFIPKDDFSLRSRYSILVNQYVQSSVAQSFYEDLQEFSNIRTLFAQTQPGFVQGNIEVDGNIGERVLGVFEVASVSSRRIFVDRENFFPDDNRPPHIIECNPVEFPLDSETLFQFIDSGSHKFFGEGLGTIFVVETGCVDCTLFGSNIRPDFWED